MYRNRCIEFWRFIFAFAIVVMHFNETYQIKVFGTFRTAFFSGAGLGVDFFFILSGFLMVASYEKSLDKHIDITPIQFLFKKITNIIKDYFVAFFLLFTYTFIYKVNFIPSIDSIKLLLNQLFQYKWELLMLHMSEFGEKIYINYPTWYVSVMMIGIYFAYALISINKKVFINFIAPLIILIGGAYLANKNGTSLLWYEYNGILNIGWIRCIVDICIGSITWYAYRYFSNKRSKQNTLILSMVEIFCVFRIIYAILYHKNARNDFWDMLVFAILIMISFLNVSFIDKIIDNKISEFLGKLSLNMYLNQVFLMSIYFDIFGIDKPFKFALPLAITVILLGSILIQILIRIFSDKFNKITHKIKNKKIV